MVNCIAEYRLVIYRSTRHFSLNRNTRSCVNFHAYPTHLLITEKRKQRMRDVLRVCPIFIDRKHLHFLPLVHHWGFLILNQTLWTEYINWFKNKRWWICRQSLAQTAVFCKSRAFSLYKGWGKTPYKPVTVVKFLASSSNITKLSAICKSSLHRIRDRSVNFGRAKLIFL